MFIRVVLVIGHWSFSGKLALVAGIVSIETAKLLRHCRLARLVKIEAIARPTGLIGPRYVARAAAMEADDAANEGLPTGTGVFQELRR